MNHRRLATAALAGLLLFGLAACGTQVDPGSATAPTAPPLAAASPTGVPAAATPAARPTAALDSGVSGIGVVRPAQDANLTFAIQGIVDRVVVEEGDTVKRGQLLAILDVRTFDQQVEMAEAALEIARAQAAALSEPPRAADVRAAQAQVRQAQIAVAQTRTTQGQSVRSAQAGVDMAQSNLQSARDRLSAAKSQAEAQLRSAAEALVQAQARYATAKANWDYAADTGADPTHPNITDPASGKSRKNKLNDVQTRQYYEAFVQAEAAMKQAELGVQQAQVGYDSARQAEVNGIQVAEQQATQAQASLEIQNLPAEADRVASAQAGLELARANLARLAPAPRESDVAQAQARVRQAQSTLDAARLSRERAEMRAPFDGIINRINIDPGDPSSPAGVVPIALVDASRLYVDVDINDVDIGKVKLGQPAALYADAMPDTRYTGNVTFIASSATVAGNARTYVARITLDKQEGLRPGMRVRVLIEG